MLPRCSQLKVAGPLQTQDIWALRHIFILFLRKVYGTESLRRAGEDRGAQSSRDHWGKWEKVSSKPKKASKSVLFRFSMWTEPRSWPNCPSVLWAWVATAQPSSAPDHSETATKGQSQLGRQAASLRRHRGVFISELFPHS